MKAQTSRTGWQQTIAIVSTLCCRLGRRRRLFVTVGNGDAEGVDADGSAGGDRGGGGSTLPCFAMLLLAAVGVASAAAARADASALLRSCERQSFNISVCD